MKKFLFTMMAALLVCGMSFAQNPKSTQTKLSIAGVEMNGQNTERSGWIGQSSVMDYALPLETGQFVAFAPRALSPSVTGSITKLEVGVCNWPQHNGGNMRIGIYPVPTLTQVGTYQGVYEVPTLGTEISGIDLNLTSSIPAQSSYGGVAEVQLTTPLEIPAGDFWMVITAKEPICLLGANTGGAAESFFYPYDASQQELGWVFFDNINTDGTFSSPVFKIFVDDGTVYQESSDLHAMFLQSSTHEEITEPISIGETDNLTYFPYIENMGPDQFLSTGNISVSMALKVGGDSHILMSNNGPLGFNLPVGDGIQFSQNGTLTITNADLMEMIGTASSFTIELTVQTASDPDTSNNTAVLEVSILHLLPVENLVATPDGSTVHLSWDVPSRGLQGYRIFRDGTQIKLQTASQTTYSDLNVADGEHEYCIVAVYAEGSSEQACTETTVDGINSISAENVAVYPNPANSYVKIANAEGARISVINSVGQVVANINAAAAEQEINVSGLANGIYTIRIANNDSVVTRQFSVSK